MSSERPPTIDPVAAARWHAAAPAVSPWLHEEVARRMEDRLQWIRQAPQSWCHWDAVRGGLQAHALVGARYPKARCQIYETAAHCEDVARQALARPWWSPARWSAGSPQLGVPADASVQMLWANMALHTAADPQALIAQWHRALAVDGYLMFSCLGPDTLRELHAVYARLGWPPAGHAFTDMHDWGDMLVHGGFAEPVMDMERLELTYGSAAGLVEELRGFGRNLSAGRFAACRGRGWHERMLAAIEAHGARAADGRLRLTIEIVYGHAFKAAPRPARGDATTVPLDALRDQLRQRRG